MAEMTLERAVEVLMRRLHKGLHWHELHGRAIAVPLDGFTVRESWDADVAVAVAEKLERDAAPPADAGEGDADLRQVKNDLVPLISGKPPGCFMAVTVEQVLALLAAAERGGGPGPATHSLPDAIAGLSANDPWVSDLQFHPSDWERPFDAKEKMRERRPELTRAFDSAMNAVGRDKDLAAEQLGYIAAVAINAGTQLGLDMAADLARRAALDPEAPR